MDTASVLNAAADLLEKPGAWTQGQMAVSKGGKVVLPGAPTAARWCAAGAMRKVAFADPGTLSNAYWLGMRQLSAAIGGKRITAWNDDPSRTQSEVVATLRAAAVKAGEPA